MQATAKRLNFDDKAWLSAPYGPVQLQSWTSTDTPTVVSDGVPAFGATLTADPGPGWAPAPDRYSYQWKRNGSVIPGATYANYSVHAEDVGSRISAVVSGVKTGFSAAPQESGTVSILGATMPGATPMVSGTPQVGKQLTGTITDWDPSGSTLTFQWYAGDTLIQQGSAFLVVPASAVGEEIVLKVTGRRAGYTPKTVASVPTTAVVPGELTASRPSINGQARVGQTLIASAGGWAPNGVKISYRWRIGTKVVTGHKGAKQTFVIPRTARGKKISVVVTGQMPGYTTVKKTSAPTAKVTR